MTDYSRLAAELSSWIETQVTAAGLKGAVFGLSGGIDSAVVAGLAQSVLGDSAVGVIMPCHSNPEDREHALLCARTFGLRVLEVDLTSSYDTLLSALGAAAPELTADRMSKANIKPRLRMSTLYYFANIYSYLVLGTGNRSEVEIGYFTKYGDGGVDAMPLAGLVKADVRELAAHLGVPEVIIQKPPSAGLWENQTDEGEMGLTYEQLDSYLSGSSIEDEVRNRIERLRQGSAHKRRMPPIPNL